MFCRKQHNYVKFYYLLFFIFMAMTASGLFISLILLLSTLFITSSSIYFYNKSLHEATAGKAREDILSGKHERKTSINISRFIISSLKKSLFISFMVIIFNIILVKTGSVLYTLNFPWGWNLNIYYGSIVFAISMSIRLIIVIIIFDLYTLWVDEDSIILDLVSKGKKSAFTMAMSIRFYPFVKNSFGNIIDAQMSRGIIKHEGIKSIKDYTYIFYPFLNSIMNKAHGLSEITAFKLNGVLYSNPVYHSIDNNSDNECKKVLHDHFSLLLLITVLMFFFFYYFYDSLHYISYLTVALYAFMSLPINFKEVKKDDY